MSSGSKTVTGACSVSGGEPACFNLPVDNVVTAYLGLGSNVGDRAANLKDALTRIGRIARIQQCSSVYETDPVGYTEQREFWNIAVSISTDLPARQLLNELIAIEVAMGRERTFRNAPRNIDIDILLYDDVVQSSGELEIPHPRMRERAFVLKPLLEIAPTITDPRTHEAYADSVDVAQLERAEIIAPPIRIEHETR